MGLAIEDDCGVGAVQRYPIPQKLVLTCDGPPGLFPPVRAEFRGPGGFIAHHRAAMAAGWLERHTAQGRIFLCPDCSRK